MKRSFQTFLFLLFLCSGCKFKGDDKYDRSEIVSKVISICKDEYHIDLSAEVVDHTLFIYLPLNDIILTAKFLSQKSLEKINNVTHAASRSSMSASNEIHFYKIVASDSKNLGIQLIITRYVKDIKKFMLGLISRNDYIQRMEMKIRFDPDIMGKNIARSFFKKMETLNPSAIISSFFPQKITVNKISPLFFSNLMEHNMKKDRNYKILKIKSKKISQYKALIYIEVRETYKIAEKYKNHSFRFPNGHVAKYLFLINTLFLPQIIENIYLLQDIDPQTSEIVDTHFPEKFEKYTDIDSWSLDKTLDTESEHLFIVRQIVNHIKMAFLKDEKIKKLFLLSSVKGNYKKNPQTGERCLHFKINVERQKAKEALSLMNDHEFIVLKKTLDTIIPLIKSFEFNKFDKMRIDYIPNNKSIFLNIESLKRFQKNKLTLKELIETGEIITSPLKL